MIDATPTCCRRGCERAIAHRPGAVAASDRRARCRRRRGLDRHRRARPRGRRALVAEQARIGDRRRRRQRIARTGRAARRAGRRHAATRSPGDVHRVIRLHRRHRRGDRSRRLAVRTRRTRRKRRWQWTTARAVRPRLGVVTRRCGGGGSGDGVGGIGEPAWWMTCGCDASMRASGCATGWPITVDRPADPRAVPARPARRFAPRARVRALLLPALRLVEIVVVVRERSRSSAISSTELTSLLRRGRRDATAERLDVLANWSRLTRAIASPIRAGRPSPGVPTTSGVPRVHRALPRRPRRSASGSTSTVPERSPTARTAGDGVPSGCAAWR